MYVLVLKLLAIYTIANTFQSRPPPLDDEENDAQLDPETREQKRKERLRREKIKKNPDGSLKHVTSISGGGSQQFRPSSDQSKKDKKKKRKST